MAYKVSTFKNKKTGQVREAPVGFSWTMLFFGSLVSLFRGDWKGTAISIVLCWLTVGLSHLVFPFFYNQMYINDLLNDGYTGV
ncbi:hypothetical protein KAR91_13635 [Candidatus Pacearchaeota archaeon]|nr:hypothetical protein [Candidatus Pacearchaeota archaeon]